MKFLNPSAPRFAETVLTDHVATAFGLTGSLHRLYSERDQNYRLQAADGSQWTFKVANIEEDVANLDCQLQALSHVARTAPALPVPRVRPDRAGRLLAPITDAEGRVHQTYVLSYLPGRIAADFALCAADHERIGRAIAQLGQALSGFFHPAMGGRGLLWDIREIGRMRAGTRHLGPLQARAEALIAGFTTDVLPRLAGLRAQAIHGDVHGHNLILAADKAVAGIIDFGDMLHGPLVLDLSNALSDFSTRPEAMEAVWAALVKGFHEVSPLRPAEVELLYDLMIMRQLVTLLINAIRQAETPDQPNYIADNGFGDANVLEAMEEIGRDRATAIFAAAAGLAAQPVRQGVADLIARRKKVMGSELYVFYDPPLHIVRGEGVWLIDAAGRRYLDCYNNVPILGHCHPRVIDAISAQIRILNTNTRYLGAEVLDYAERLGATTGGALTACVFVNSGSEANDVAWRMARAWTGNQGFLCQDFAYHGITEAIAAVSPSASKDGVMAPHVRTLLAPDTYRGPYPPGPEAAARYGADVDRAVADLAKAGMKPAAVILDSAFMTNGILEPMPGYVAEVFARTRAAGGLCIADEVQSGFGRMGDHFWGYQHHGVTPDFVTIGKPAGNGHPLGAVLTRPEILDHFVSKTAFFSTFGGNNVSVAAGLAVLEAIEDGDLVGNARRTGALFKAGLLGLKDRFPIIGDVRGMGLAFGVELVADRATRAPAAAEATRLVNLMRDEGLLAGTEGVLGNIIKMRPPIVFQPEHVEIALAAMTRALTKL